MLRAEIWTKEISFSAGFDVETLQFHTEVESKPKQNWTQKEKWIIKYFLSTTNFEILHRKQKFISVSFALFWVIEKLNENFQPISKSSPNCE